MTYFKTIASYCKLLVALTVALFSLGASAEPYFIHKDGAMVYDQATGLVWMRCSLGQTWDGVSCTGNAQTVTFNGATKNSATFNTTGGLNGHTDWVVPTIRQLQSLRECSSGFKADSHDLRDGSAKVLASCRANSKQPTISEKLMPSTASSVYWSSTERDGNHGWYVGFHDGSVGTYSRNNGAGDSPFYVRLVRAFQLSGDVVAHNFVPLVTALANENALAPQVIAKREAAENTARIERERKEAIDKSDRERKEAVEKADRERSEAAEKVAQVRKDAIEKAARAAALKKLVAGGAQSLYLQAGKAQRSGSVDVSGVSFSADELYELIVEKFPSSDFAVKAADQLNAMDRSQRQASATRDAAAASERAANAQRDADRNSSGRAACFSQVRSCEARCSDSSNRGVCIQMCQRTCN